MNAKHHPPTTRESRSVILVLAGGTLLASVIGIAGFFSRSASTPPAGPPAQADFSAANRQSAPASRRPSGAPKLVQAGTERRDRNANPVRRTGARVSSPISGGAAERLGVAAEVLAGNAKGPGDPTSGQVAERNEEIDAPGQDQAAPASGQPYLRGVQFGVNSGSQRALDGGSDAVQAATPVARTAIADAIGLPESRTGAPPAAGQEPLAGIQVAYKQDPRLTRSLHMGDRWVSPPTYTRVGDGEVLTVEAKVDGLGPAGQQFGIASQWRAADSEMIELTPGEGDTVRITVLRPGQTTLFVAAQGVSQELLVNTEHRDGTLVAQISRGP